MTAQKCNRCGEMIHDTYLLGTPMHDSEEKCVLALDVARAKVLKDHTQAAHDQRHATLPPTHVFALRVTLQQIQRDHYPKGKPMQLLYRIADAAVKRLEEIAVNEWPHVDKVKNRAKDVLEGKRI